MWRLTDFYGKLIGYFPTIDEAFAELDKRHMTSFGIRYIFN